jgi:hypothetical protein
VWKRTITTPINVLWYGAVADCDNYSGGTDNSSAFNAAFGGAAAYQPAGGGSRVGGVVFVPPGRYSFAHRLTIFTSCTFEGAHGASGWGSSVLVFKKDVGAQLVVETVVNNVVSKQEIGGAIFINGISGQGTAHGTIVRRLTVAMGDGLAPEDYLNRTCGIYVAASRVQLEDVYVGSFQGDGIIIDGDVENCDLWGLKGHIEIEGAGRYGLFVAGQAGVGTMSATLDLRKCGSWGLRQSSTFGNTYSGTLHTTGNGVQGLSGTWKGARTADVPASQIWSAGAPGIVRGQRMLPTVPKASGFQYRAIDIGGGMTGNTGGVLDGGGRSCLE